MFLLLFPGIPFVNIGNQGFPWGRKVGEERQASICCKSRNHKTSVALLSVQCVTLWILLAEEQCWVCLFIVRQVTLIEKFRSISQCLCVLCVYTRNLKILFKEKLASSKGSCFIGGENERLRFKAWFCKVQTALTHLDQVICITQSMFTYALNILSSPETQLHKT